MSEHHPGRWWHMLEDGRMQCDLCPRDCRLHEGQRGACFVRQRVGDQMMLTTYGRSSGFCIDPVEKKPLNHFYPGSSILSFGTAGCNLACRFCQNWDISKSKEVDRLTDGAAPDQIAQAALDLGPFQLAVKQAEELHTRIKTAATKMVDGFRARKEARSLGHSVGLEVHDVGGTLRDVAVGEGAVWATNRLADCCGQEE